MWAVVWCGSVHCATGCLALGLHLNLGQGNRGQGEALVADQMQRQAASGGGVGCGEQETGGAVGATEAVDHHSAVTQGPVMEQRYRLQRTVDRHFLLHVIPDVLLRGSEIDGEHISAANGGVARVAHDRRQGEGVSHGWTPPVAAGVRAIHSIGLP